MLKWLYSKFQSDSPIRGYEVEEHIFEGAFSNIYRAHRRKDEQEVALKVLTDAGEKMASMLDEHETAVWEGDLLRTLNHPNIIDYVDSGTGSTYWIAMEYIRSRLGTYIGRCNNEEEENDLLDILSQVASALTYLHGRNLVHRDICLGNILLTPDGTAKLIDFGMTVPKGCKLVRGRVGTPSYMAPEMIKTSQYTPSADMYSFGIVMYELITGEKPFQGQMREQRMTRSLNVNPLSPSRLGRYCSPELERLVMKCISKDLDERPCEAREVEQSLFLLRHQRGLT